MLLNGTLLNGTLQEWDATEWNAVEMYAIEQCPTERTVRYATDWYAFVLGGPFSQLGLLCQAELFFRTTGTSV